MLTASLHRQDGDDDDDADDKDSAYILFPVGQAQLSRAYQYKQYKYLLKFRHGNVLRLAKCPRAPQLLKILFFQKEINSFDRYSKIKGDAMWNYVLQSLKVEIECSRF